MSENKKISFNEILISLIQENRCLWDLRDPNHNDKLHRRKTWLGIAQRLKKSDTFVKTRWRTLRDRYRREFKKRTSEQSIEYSSNWCLLPLLEFLRDSISSDTDFELDEAVEGIVSTKASRLSRQSSSPTEEYPTRPILPASTFEHPSEALLLSLEECPSTPRSAHSGCPKGSKRRRSSSPDAIESAILTHKNRRRLVSQQSFSAEEHFYMSIAKDVEKLSLPLRLEVRQATLAALMEAVQKENIGN